MCLWDGNRRSRSELKKGEHEIMRLPEARHGIEAQPIRHTRVSELDRDANALQESEVARVQALRRSRDPRL